MTHCKKVGARPNCFLLPTWNPLRGDPRFEKIAASLAPKESNHGLLG
jgi:cell wall assembly regulator SMI1